VANPVTRTPFLSKWSRERATWMDLQNAENGEEGKEKSQMGMWIGCRKWSFLVAWAELWGLLWVKADRTYLSSQKSRSNSEFQFQFQISVWIQSKFYFLFSEKQIFFMSACFFLFLLPLYIFIILYVFIILYIIICFYYIIYYYIFCFILGGHFNLPVEPMVQFVLGKVAACRKGE